MARFGLRDGREQDDEGNWRLRLIATGWVHALPADEIQPGMTRLYNYGGREPIFSVERKGQWVTITVKKDGKLYHQRLRHNSPLPVLECQPFYRRQQARSEVQP